MVLSYDSPIGFNGLPNMSQRLFDPYIDLKSAIHCNLNANSSQMTLVSTTHISVWADQSGSGRDGSQGTDAARMTYNATGGPQSLPCVDTVAASGQYVLFADVFSSLTAAEAFVVRKLATDPPSGSSSGGMWKFGTAGSADNVPFTDGTIYDGFGSTARKTTVNPTPSMANWHIYNVTSISGEWTNRLNGAQLFTTATNTVGFNTAPRFGSEAAAAIDASFTTLWIFNRKLNAFERWGMNTYLNRRWLLGLTF